MKKRKFGEETVPVRVPLSRKDDVLRYLKKFEVLDLGGSDLDIVQDEYRLAYERGYLDGFQKGEESQVVLSALLAGDESAADLALDLFRNRVPDSSFFPALQHLSKVFIDAPEISDMAFSLLPLLRSRGGAS